MKNITSLRIAWLENLRNTLFLGILIAMSAFAISSLDGCSSGPTSPGTSSGGVETTTIYGRVTDETGIPVTGASVTGGTKTTVTDANGFYIIKDATVPKGRAIVTAKKAGFFNAAKAEVPVATGTRIEMSMMSDASTATIPASSGGTVPVTGGASIGFSPGSFTDASGAAYSGTVKVSARYLDPKNPSFFDYFSGDDMALASSGKNVSLISSGVLRVELKDQSGNTLKLDPSKPATLSYPKPLDTKAPSTMPLWYFDESLGMWKAEGSATLANGMYSGTVSHFTDWNLDYFDSTGNFGVYGDVTLRVVCNGAPVSGVVITIVGDDNPGNKYFVHPGGKTGPDGTIHFVRFPANRPTLVDIRSDKNNGLYFINSPKAVNITPGQSLDLGDITLDSPCPATVKGTLTGCDDSKTEGLVTISDGTHISYVYTKNGDFAVQAQGLVPLTVDAMDVNGNQATTVSVPALSSSELRDIGNIKICGGATSTFVDITTPVGKDQSQIISLSPDGSRLAVWSIQPAGFTVYDTKTGNIVSTATITGASYYNNLEFSVDNTKLLVTPSYSGPSMVYDVTGATASQIISIPDAFSGKLYDDGSKIIALKSMTYPNPPVVNIYNVSDGSIKSTLHPTFTSGTDSLGHFGFIPDEESIVYPDDKTNSYRVWSATTDAEIRNFPTAGQGYTFYASEDGLTAASSLDYITYSAYDTKTGSKRGDVKTTGTNGTRYSNPLFTKNYAYIADQVSGANVIRITKIADGTSTVKLLSNGTYVSSVAASRNEQYLAAATSGLIRIWKLQ